MFLCFWLGSGHFYCKILFFMSLSRHKFVKIQTFVLSLMHTDISRRWTLKTLVTFEGLGQRPKCSKPLSSQYQALVLSCLQQDFKDVSGVFVLFVLYKCFLLIFLLSLRLLPALEMKELTLKHFILWVSESFLTLNQALLLLAPFIMIMYYSKLKMARRKLLGWCLNTLNEGLLSLKTIATLPLFA